MATRSKATIPELTTPIKQGDIYKDVRFSYIDSEDDSGVNVVEFEFPMAVIISQACDVIAMEEIILDKAGKPTKFMPSILLCPIYDKTVAKRGDHLVDAFEKLDLIIEKENVFQTDDYSVAKRDWHYRFHSLEIAVGEKDVLKNGIIDFKHYFTVPMSYLVANKHNRVFHLDDLFAEQLSLKFATFISRVAVPN